MRNAPVRKIKNNKNCPINAFERDTGPQFLVSLHTVVVTP